MTQTHVCVWFDTSCFAVNRETVTHTASSAGAAAVAVAAVAVEVAAAAAAAAAASQHGVIWRPLSGWVN